MARTNKYTSLNFNDIYEKKLRPTNKPSSSSSPSQSPSSSSNTTNHLHKNHLSAARTHGSGRMLVLTRPTPKPIPIPQPPPSPPPTQSSHQPDQTRLEPDSISLRPLGSTGSGPSLASSAPVLNQEREREALLGVTSPKPDRFVPPHLRPGFVGKEEKFGPEVQKQIGIRSREFVNRQVHFGSPGRYGEDGRPKSGGGYERIRRGGGESDLMEMSRPSSSGSRPSSSG